MSSFLSSNFGAWQGSFLKKVANQNMSKLHTFVNLSSKDKWQAFRLLYLLPKSRWAVKRTPFKKVAERMGVLSEPKEVPVSAHEEAMAVQWGALTRSVGKLMPFRTLCFEQALSCAALLQAQGIAHCIHFGVKKHPEDAKRLEAHAWLQCGNAIVTGKKKHRQFKRVSSFYYDPSKR